MVYNMMEWGSGMMGLGFGGLFMWLIALGLVLVVWLWVIKLWREVVQRKRK